MTTQSAAERVINIPELCEQILEYLPCADLGRARCVCRQFEAVINQSTIMKQRVSLRIASKHTVWTTPTYGTLLTGIYAEDHMAAAKAKGDRLDEFNVYELHAYLKVVHGNYEGEQFSHKMVVKRSYYWSDWQF